MAISIFTNLTSLNAQRILGINNDRLEQSIERVFSGLRINTAFSTIPVDWQSRIPSGRISAYFVRV